MKSRPVAVDAFCGAGGLSLGLEQAGFEVKLAFDANPIHAATHEVNFPRCVTLTAEAESVTGDIVLKSIGGVPDLLAGGPPCQGFSAIGGRRAGDPRNKLIFDFARIVAEARPRYFLFENVVGFLHKPYAAIRGELFRRFSNAGYAIVEPVEILDAAGFGVPQRRKRVFLLGYADGETPPAYPMQSGAPPSVWEAIGDLPSLVDRPEYFERDEFRGQLGIPSPYAAELRGPGSETIGGFLRTRHSDAVARRFARTEPGGRERVSRFDRLDAAGISTTLRAGTPKGYGKFTAARPIHPVEPRCITVREAARLSSFPDAFEFHPTRWHGLQQVGNAVPPKLAMAVGRRIRLALDGKSVRDDE